MDRTLKSVIFCFVFGFVAFLAGRKDISFSLLRIFAVVVVLLGLFIFLFSTFISPIVERIRRRGPTEAQNELPDEEHVRRRQEGLERLRARHDATAVEIAARKARHEEERTNAKEKSFQQFSPSWKGKGESLGGDSQTSHRRGRVESQAESLEVSRKPKEIPVELEAEAPEGDPGTMALSFRLPSGGSVKRRFRSSSPMLQLHAFLESKGYPPSQFRVYNLFPRQRIAPKDDPISQLSPGRGLTLVVEELYEDDSADETAKEK